MRRLLVVVLVPTLYVTILSLFIALALGMAALLHWLVPSIDLGIAVLIVLLASIVCGRAIASILSVVEGLVSRSAEANNDSESDSDVESDPNEQAELIAKYVAAELFEHVSQSISSANPERRRRQRR